MNPSDQARWIGAAPTYLGQYRVAGFIQNAAAQTVLVDTGAMAAGWYDVFVDASSSSVIAWDQWQLQWRNAANNANLVRLMLMAAAGISKSVRWYGIYIAANERLQLCTYAAHTGDFDGVIIAVRRA